MWDDSTIELMNMLPIGVVELDAEGRIFSANRVGLELLGLDETARRANVAFSALCPEALGRALASPGNGLQSLTWQEGNRTCHAEIRSRSEDRKRLLILREITELSGMSLLRRNFVFDVLHRLRTPLTTIVSVLSMATTGRLDSNRVDYSEILGMAGLQADRLTDLLEGLRDLYLVESGEIDDEIQLETIPLAETIAEVTLHLKSRFAAKQITLLEEYNDSEFVAIADRSAFSRSLRSILQNALLYTHQAATVRIGIERRPDHVVVIVSDDGPGIPEEELPHVFTRFRRGSGKTVLSTEGEGLGLYLARHLLSAQNATLRIDSRPGAGTTAEIYLATPGEDS